jgi:hypothetical protein
VREELVDVGFARDFDVTVGLFYIDTVERLQDTLVAEVDAVFGADHTPDEVADGVSVGTYDGKIVDLTADEHAVAVESALVQATLMRRRCEPMPSDDGVHKLFPEGAGFRMSLKGVLNGEDHITWDCDIMSSEVPVSVLVVDDDKRWLVGGRQICIGIGCVNLQADKTLMGAQGEKQAHAGLLNTTGVGVGQFELWGSTRGAVATIACLPSSIAFDAVVPVLSEDDRSFRCVNRGAINFLVLSRNQAA